MIISSCIMAVKFLFISMAIIWLMAAANARDMHIKPGVSLTARLETSGSLVDCWDALVELKSCSSEIVLFFLNGQADIGPGCCRAIGIITRNCWPAMLTSLGFTAEEGDILRGYCDASFAGAPAAAAPVGAPTPSYV